MAMCRVRGGMGYQAAPIEVIVRHVEIIEPDAELDARLRRFEEAADKGLLAYEGIYEPDRIYPKGSMVTWGGSIWHAKRETSSRPDGNFDDWTLAVKRGRNGRDRRDTDRWTDREASE